MSMGDEWVSKFDHIPNEEVIQDIRDTEREIADMEREEKGLRMMGNRISDFRADARRHGIVRRQEFIAKLRRLLQARGSSCS